MSSAFFSVFDEIEVNKVLEEAFENTTIEKVSRTKDQTVLRIYLKADFLVPKWQVIRMEEEIYSQYFSDSDINQVQIIEHFLLPEKYTLSQVLDEYKDSIIEDFIKESHSKHTILSNSEWTLSDDVISILLDDTYLGRLCAGDIARRIESILFNRCGFMSKINIDFRQIKSNDNENIPPVSDEFDDQQDYVDYDLPWEASYEPEIEPYPVVEMPVLEEDNLAPVAQQPSVSDKAETKIDNIQNKTAVKKGNLSKKGKSSYSEDRNRKDEIPEGYIIGRKFDDDDFTAVEDIDGEIGYVCVRGQVSALECRELRKKKDVFICSFTITDFTDTIAVKGFYNLDQKTILEKELKAGGFYELKGKCLYDDYNKEYAINSVVGIRKGSDFRTKRVDNAPVKRVELHLHTKSSEMDAVSEVKDIIKTVKGWGHKAVAITDHGVVHAFAAVSHEIKPSDRSLKILYGCEGYLVDDEYNAVTDGDDSLLTDHEYVAFDIETTGFSSEKDYIIEIGATKYKNGKVVDNFSSFVCPPISIPYRIEKLTGINDAMVNGAKAIEEVLPEFIKFCDGCVMIAHNAGFDMGFIKQKALELGLSFEHTYIDTVAFARTVLTELGKYTLDNVAKNLKITLENHHRAVDDAKCCGEIYWRLIERIDSDKIKTLNDLNDMCSCTPEIVKKLKYYHVILLATNTIGRYNLYRLVSMSHLKYFNRRPRIPKSVLSEYREGIIVGSACEAGELISAIVSKKSEKEIIRIAKYYDYLEIQPIGNNAFMLTKEDNGYDTDEDLRDINRKVVQLGELLHKPVVATTDSHFVNPEDEIYRRIIMFGKGFADADNQPPLYLRTTEEMLAEFDYLGAQKAYEVVVTNTNMIADRCDFITPVRPDKCPPFIQDSDKTLRSICYNTARAQYGDPLPEIVEKRLERELNSIISNGYAVMYIIAQKLVNKSNEDGYLVGSRGSVGSSFAATMSGITEVNPLSPHYYCKKCKYSDFYSDEVKAYGGGAGCDMPDKKCPVCGEPLIKDGFDIPFETFLGFKGDKEPDIDLNFSGEYQSKAHAYTEVIFGYGQTFRAGTISALADKTAFGYVKKYYEEHEETKRTAEILRLAAGCTGVRSSTGQHPGGIIVLPVGEDINTFTPIQHPANDTETATITTHFDYHSIDHNLLKLDILGHDDPTMIRMIQDLTGLDPRTFPLDSKEVMSLFMNTEALKITPDQLTNCRLGCLGIPEFGTDFAMQMVIDAKPTQFSDLVRISGLSHGTDVWLGNAQTLIQEGKATISTAICTRDDIMTYLISKGVESERSFKIMEMVRKGIVAKGKCDAWPEWKQDMLDHDVPEWYIWSCEKIKYMFPKAHAAAYVMMAWRIAYCKVFYPLAYYTAYFSIRATGFSYELMCMGHEQLNELVKKYYSKKDELSSHDKDALKDMRIVQEMFARGYDFMPIDIYRAKAKRFQIIDNKIMPSFASIEGMGDKAAESMELAALDGPYVSREDIKNRAKISQTLLDKLGELGLLGDLPMSNQFSLMDLGLI